jgi:hypothetical protein
MTKNELMEIFDEEKHDGILFFEEKQKLDVSSFSYLEKLPPVEKHELGYKYHLITYKETDDEEDIDDLSHVEAILGDPHYYVSHLIRIGFRGLIAKKTENSSEVLQDMLENLGLV